MPSSAYSIALIARGTGAYAYSYLGPPGLSRGQLVLVSFRSVLEIGLLLHEDQRPPEDTALLACIPIAAPHYPQFGAVLADIAELCCSGPDEVAGHVLFDSPSTGLRLSLELGAAAQLRELLLAAEQSVLLAGTKPARGRLSGDKLLAELARLSGVLTPARRKSLLKAAGWPLLVGLTQSGALSFSLGLAGTPEVMRRHNAWPQRYEFSPAAAAAAGLGAQTLSLPGSYLAGLENPPPLDSLPRLKDVTAGKTAAAPISCATPAHREEAGQSSSAILEWDKLRWETRWDLLQRWPQVGQLGFRRCQSSWPKLEQGALAAEIEAALSAGQRVLLLAPMAWMLDRLWPRLLPLASHVLRFRPEAGPLVAAQLLRQAAAANGVLVGGTAGAWKLAACLAFDRIILLDPSHPQYEPHGEPWLEPLAATLLAAARLAAGTQSAPAAQIDCIELSLSRIDGKCSVPGVQLQPQIPDPSQLAELCIKPSLLYLNRLGGGRELSCSECHAAVPCPSCGGRRVYFRPARRSFLCPDCEWHAADLRCPRCGLQNLAAASPGLENLSMPPDAVLIRGADAQQSGGYPAGSDEAGCIYGTARLLEPSSSYIQRHIIYIHAEAQTGVLSDWPDALDNALRLALLYSDPDSWKAEAPLLIGAQLYEQLGAQAAPAAPDAAPYITPGSAAADPSEPAELSASEIASLLQAELKLRRLSGLPPFGCVYQLRARSLSREALDAGRELLGQRLQSDPGTSLLRLGRVYSAGLEGGKRIQRFGGWLVNARLGHAELQELRWQLHQLGAGLQYRPLRGPWI